MVAMEEGGEVRVWVEERERTRRTTMSMQAETGVMMRMSSSPRVERREVGGLGSASAIREEEEEKGRFFRVRTWK